MVIASGRHTAVLANPPASTGGTDSDSQPSFRIGTFEVASQKTLAALPASRLPGYVRERRSASLDAVYLGAPAIASIRFFISSGDTSSMWVATYH
jgi:hypothetical protein